VFISHTSEFGDFPEDRSFVAAAVDAARDAGDEPVEMGDFPAGRPPPAEVCRQKIETCDVYVALVGFRYGSTVPRLRGKSYVEFEWEVASKRGLPILIFLLDERAVVPGSFHDPHFYRQQARLRTQMGSKHHLRRFRTAQELHKLLSEALSHLPVEPGAGPPPPSDTRLRNRVIAIGAAALLVAGASVAVAASLLGGPGGSILPKLGVCSRVDIFTGHGDSPYHRYGQVLERRIESAFPGTAVTVQETSGTSDNINRLRDRAAASCELAVIQLNGGVDARAGVQDFEGKPFDELRTVGPLWFDLIQLAVRRDSAVHAAADLCDGKKVATGPEGSGVKQIGDVLLRQIRYRTPGCKLFDQRWTLAGGLAELRAGKVDAVLWSGGSPTSTIRDAIDDGLEIRMIPLDGYQAAMQEEWNGFYRSKLGGAFFPGDVYQIEQISRGDYPGVDPTRTVAIPNGVVVNEVADDDLARFVAESLFADDRADFERALWGDAQGARQFPGALDTVATSPLYCLVPLHPAAAAYYEGMGIHAPCRP
jgi:TRAP transporter TAXI family solute receptor